MAVSGDRDGVGMVWDLQTGKLTPMGSTLNRNLFASLFDIHTGAARGKLQGHKGHLTSVGWLRSGPGLPSNADLILTGAQDGHIRAWDARMKTCVANVGAHEHPEGTGAVGEIRSTTVDGHDSLDPNAGSDLVITAGADKGVCVLDPRASFNVVHRFTEHRYVRKET